MTSPTTRQKKRWTADDDQLLMERFHSCTIKELARMIGCGFSTVKWHCKALGLKKENPYGRNDDARAFIEMEFDNLSYPEMTKQTGLSTQSIRKIARELGLWRTPEQMSTNKSRSMKKTFGSERARATFGLDQRTGLRVFRHDRKNNLRAQLRRCGYIVRRGDNIIYYTDNLVRRPIREKNGQKLGIEFRPLPSACAEETGELPASPAVSGNGTDYTFLTP